MHFKLEFNFVANETAILVTHTYHVQAQVAENFTAFFFFFLGVGRG